VPGSPQRGGDIVPIGDLFANGLKPSILILITDQERTLSEWLESYRATLAGKLKAMQALGPTA
jgi:choline-sulfatase